MNRNEKPGGQNGIWSVSELTRKIKQILEDKFAFIWIHGEISNLRIPSSGHAYFTLKDVQAQISAVLFRTQLKSLRFLPEDGLEIVGMGRVSLYAPRGNYQIILEYCEPAGAGALQIAFEQLKRKLSTEGLFDAQHKRPLPFLPRKIALITSPSGAVIHDIQTVLQRRFRGMETELLPVAVQGGQAVLQICEALEKLDAMKSVDVAILARGGGSLEDLQAFNDERVARAIFDAPVPVVSAVGHETDFTIADFVADLRAPTPSAAAEMVVPLKSDLRASVDGLSAILFERMQLHLHRWHEKNQFLHQRLVHPRRRMEDLRLRLDELAERLQKSHRSLRNQKRQNLAWLDERLRLAQILKRVQDAKATVAQKLSNIQYQMNNAMSEKRAVLGRAHFGLQALSPQAVLARGYSLTRKVPGNEILRDSRHTHRGDGLQVQLAHGILAVRVEDTQHD